MQGMREFRGEWIELRCRMRGLKTLRLQGTQQRFSVLLALSNDVVFNLCAWIQIQTAPQFDVASLPVAAQGRHVMRRDGGQRVPHILIGTPEPAIEFFE